MKIYLKITAAFMLMGALTFTACFVGGGSSGGNDIAAASSTLFASKTSIAAGVECAAGGVQIDMGFDVNQNNVLDIDEIKKTEYVCNGVNGTNGAAGATGETGETGAAGTNGTDASSHPFVVYSSPAANEAGVELNAVINVVFNIEMKSTPATDSDSVTYEGAFTVREENGNKVSGAISYAGIVATFTPTQNLIQNKRYSVNLSSAIKNVNGVTLGYTHKTYFTTKSLEIGTMVYVPAGSFQRDAVATNISVISAHFHMSANLITRDQFLAVMGTDPSFLPYSSGTNNPVQNVSWYHAIAFCNKLSIADGLTPVYSVTGVNFATLTFASIPTNSNVTWNAAVATLTNTGYRLPTEMQWMWAAIGAKSSSRTTDMVGGVNTGGYTKGYAGSTETAGAVVNINSYAWLNYNSSGCTHPVGIKLPNELGLYDMSGNVWEWNWDLADTTSWPSYTIIGTVTSDSAAGLGAASGTGRIMRGGGFLDATSIASVAFRILGFPYGQDTLYGFRVVRP